MRIDISETPKELGGRAAQEVANRLRGAIAKQGYARLLLSTGASQFETLTALREMDIDWGKVDAFHLDEYMSLSIEHPASFRRYLQERFVSHVPSLTMHFVETEGDVQENMAMVSRRIREHPIDVALIGIGENAHIAFNDPPANFDTTEAYHIVTLDEACRRQQVREGWFASIDEVPTEAVSMTVYQIMQSRAIVSAVPHEVKSHAIKRTLESEVNNQVPATMLKKHPDFQLYLDKPSASRFVTL